MSNIRYITHILLTKSDYKLVQVIKKHDTFALENY